MADEDIDSLIQREKLGQELNFENQRDLFEGIKEVAQDLSELDFTKLPSGIQKALYNDITDVDDRLSYIRNFDPSSQANKRQNFINNLERTYRNLLNDYGKISGFLDRGDEVENLRNKLETVIKEAEEKNKEADRILDNIKEAAGQAGVEQQSKKFENLKKDYARSAERWIISAGAFAAMAIWGVILNIFIFGVPANASMAKLIEYTAGRIAILSILTYGMVVSTRNYFAAKHNFAINKHREAALDTFRTFVDSAESQEIKDVVLEKSAETIFSAQDSGYRKNSSDQGGNSVVDVVRQVAQTNPN